MYNMLIKLQSKTLIPVQIIGYALGLFIGITIILSSIRFYNDVQSVLSTQTDVFKNNTAVISKNVSLFKTLGNSKIYFSSKDIEELKNQDFVSNVSSFSNSTFEVTAFTGAGGNLPGFQSDLFFESIPDQYIDVATDDWKWEEGHDFLPIIIPEDYLNLYNFGFAESQGLPVFSKNAISDISFSIRVSGNNKMQFYKSRIVGFSSKINSILVPDTFLKFANSEFGRQAESNPNRLLIEMNKPADESMLKYFNDKNYSISKEKLEQGKILFFFRAAFGFVFLIALIITLLSVSFIYLSFSLIFEKNKVLIDNLFNIGYPAARIAVFYQWVISLVTVVSVVMAMIMSISVRNAYLSRFNHLVDLDVPADNILWYGTAVLLCLLIIYNVFLPAKIRKIVRNER
jgi:hypothetical protein